MEVDLMNWLGIFLIALGMFYLIYSIMFRNKATIYFKSMKIIKEKENEYLKLQLYFSILNALIIIVIGIIVVIYNLNNAYVIASPLILHLVNFIMKIISKRKGYVET